jgi:hypothetical protein
MATTYQPNKNIGEPAINDTGWGTTLNATFSTIDSAFGANSTIPLTSGTVTLSLGQYIGLSWTLTGTLSGNVVISLPAITPGSIWPGGQWTVYNTCAQGSYTITVSAAGASGSTVTITSGIQIIYSDGLGNIRASALQVGGPVTITPTGVTVSAALSVTSTVAVTGDITMSGTGEIGLPAGSTAQRSATPATGMFRFNTDLTRFEGYNGSAWGAVGGGATGGGTDQIFSLNGQTITTSYAIPSGQNALTVGPVRVNSGAVVTVPSGSRWVVL